MFGNLHTPAPMVDAVAEGIKSGKYSGYGHSAGLPASRAAIAKAFSYPGSEVTAEDVVVANGCSGALDLAITAIGNEGDNILIPNPGFSLYETLAASKGIACRKYKLNVSTAARLVVLRRNAFTRSPKHCAAGESVGSGLGRHGRPHQQPHTCHTGEQP